TEETMRHLPGFVSANLHLSRDRRYVANYAQWRSQEHFDAMLKHP
ncbi:MAG: antibiotic biosynthesis monooxygenase, partial [Actinobacteria bacterium]|nr:antibiotic biosynthesis monooxygenase [Actinomycetota bacterium]